MPVRKSFRILDLEASVNLSRRPPPRAAREASISGRPLPPSSSSASPPPKRSPAKPRGRKDGGGGAPRFLVDLVSSGRPGEQPRAVATVTARSAPPWADLAGWRLAAEMDTRCGWVDGGGDGKGWDDGGGDGDGGDGGRGAGSGRAEGGSSPPTADLATRQPDRASSWRGQRSSRRRGGNSRASSWKGRPSRRRQRGGNIHWQELLDVVLSAAVAADGGRGIRSVHSGSRPVWVWPSVGRLATGGRLATPIGDSGGGCWLLGGGGRRCSGRS
uniref:Uncharacterized protein n=1 Tax=Oryza rufipogon TaxID=4529 RepID=A0A0E0PYY1_ORYRU